MNYRCTLLLISSSRVNISLMHKKYALKKNKIEYKIALTIVQK